MAGAPRPSCLPRALSREWFRAGLADGGADTLAMTASRVLSSVGGPSCWAMRCSRVSTESSAAGARRALRAGPATPGTHRDRAGVGLGAETWS